MKLIILSCAWIAGILLGTGLSLPPYAVLTALGIPFLLILLGRNKRACLWGGLGLLFVLGGLLRLQFANSDSTLPLYNDQGRVEIEGTISRDPELESSFTKLRLTTQKIKANGEWQAVSGDILIYTKSLPSYIYGDRIRVAGNLQSPPQLEGFDYRAYLARQGIYSIMSYPYIEPIGSGGLPHLRERLARSLASALHEPQCSLAQAFLLGLRRSIPGSLLDAFRRSGTTHLIAISGLNIAILAGQALTTSAWLFGRQRPIYIMVAFGTIWLYTLLAGMSPPTLRAAIMFTLYLLALWAGRPRSVLPPLFLAAAVMVGISPRLLQDVSFQLSFAAVAGVIFIALPLSHTLHGRFTSDPTARKGTTRLIYPLIDSFTITLGATIATFPLIIYYFHQTSLVGLPANLLVLPAVPGTIIASLFTAVLGLFVPILSEIVGWVVWLLFGYIIVIAEGFASLPSASLPIGAISGIWVWTYYGILVTALWLISNRSLVSTGLSRIRGWIRS